MSEQQTFEQDAHRTWRREYQREWRLKNPERERRYRYRHRYGITEVDFDRMFSEQGGVCAMCQEPETALWMGTERVRPLSVDHDHATGKVRGLLCHRCNRILGLMKDDPAWLRRALAYLER